MQRNQAGRKTGKPTPTNQRQTETHIKTHKPKNKNANKWMEKQSCLRVTCMVARIVYIQKNGWNAHFSTQLLHDKSRKCHTTCASFRTNKLGLVIGCKIMRIDQPSMHLMPRFPSHRGNLHVPVASFLQVANQALR